MVPGDHAEQAGEVLSSKVLSSKDTISTLAENAQTAMSALYQVHTVLLNTTGTDSQKNLLQPLLGAKDDYHKFCENCILFLQHCYGVVDDFIFLTQYDFDKQSVSEFVAFIKGMLPRTRAIVEEVVQLKEAVPLRQGLLADDPGLKKKIHAILQKSAKTNSESRLMAREGDVDSTNDRFVQTALNAARPNGKLALETAEATFQKMYELLQTLQDSWSQDTRSLETFINASTRPEGVSQIPKGIEATGMGGSWVEYQTILMTAESSILQTSDVLRVDPPVVKSIEVPPRPNMFRRIIQALKATFKRG